MASERDARGQSGLRSAAWLAAALASGRPIRVLHVSWGPAVAAESYLTGRVAGALHLDTDRLEDGYPTWALRPIADLHALLGEFGVDGDSEVVVYGEQFIAVARAWWALLYAGVRAVHILDGGLPAWRQAGGPVEAGDAAAPVPTVFHARPRFDVLASAADVQAALDSGGVVIGDVRSEAEFEGEISGYDYLDARGRVPNAIHLGDADDSAGRYVGAGGRMRTPEELFAEWHRAGIRGSPPRFERDVIFMCGGGWRSSAAFFAAWCAGYRNIRNYSAGWAGWSTRYEPDLAATGSTPGWRQHETGNPFVRGRP